MKRLLLILTLIVASTCIATAQNYKEYDDVIYGTDGSVVRGTIIEQVPGVSYKIATEGGNIFVFDALKIEKITKEPPIANPYKESGVRYDEYGQELDKKSPFFSAVGSACIPGLGQMINGQMRKGLLIMGGHYACLAAFYASTYFADNGLMGGDSTPWEITSLACLAGYLGTWFYSFIDAPLYASKWNEANGFAVGDGKWLRVAPSVGVSSTVATGTAPTFGLGATLTF